MEAWPSTVTTDAVKTTQPLPSTVETGFQPSNSGASHDFGATPQTNNVPVIRQLPGSAPPSYVGHIVLAVFALIAAFPFGLPALVLAGMYMNG
jgi:ABC-type dipeptide/oligopeptide/nickel transport system permease component